MQNTPKRKSKRPKKNAITDTIVSPNFTCGSCLPYILSYHIFSFVSEMFSSTIAFNIPLEYVHCTSRIELEYKYTNEDHKIVLDYNKEILVNEEIDKVDAVFRLYEIFAMNSTYFNRFHLKMIVRTFDTLHKKMLLNIAIMASLFKCMLWLERENKRMTELHVMNLIRVIEPYIIYPMSNKIMLYHIRYNATTRVRTKNAFLNELVILGIDMAPENLAKKCDLYERFYFKDIDKSKLSKFMVYRNRKVADVMLHNLMKAVEDFNFTEYGRVIQKDSRDFISSLIDYYPSIIYVNEFYEMLIRIVEAINDCYQRCYRTDVRICFYKMDFMYDGYIGTLECYKYFVYYFLQKLFTKISFQIVKDEYNNYIDFNSFSYNIIKQLKKEIIVENLIIVEFEANIWENKGKPRKHCGLTPDIGEGMKNKYVKAKIKKKVLERLLKLNPQDEEKYNSSAFVNSNNVSETKVITSNSKIEKIEKVDLYVPTSSRKDYGSVSNLSNSINQSNQNSIKNSPTSSPSPPKKKLIARQYSKRIKRDDSINSKASKMHKRSKSKSSSSSDNMTFEKNMEKDKQQLNLKKRPTKEIEENVFKPPENIFKNKNLDKQPSSTTPVYKKKKTEDALPKVTWDVEEPLTKKEKNAIAIIKNNFNKQVTLTKSIIKHARRGALKLMHQFGDKLESSDLEIIGKIIEMSTANQENNVSQLIIQSENNTEKYWNELKKNNDYIQRINEIRINEDFKQDIREYIKTGKELKYTVDMNDHDREHITLVNDDILNVSSDEYEEEEEMDPVNEQDESNHDNEEFLADNINKTIQQINTKIEKKYSVKSKESILADVNEINSSKGDQDSESSLQESGEFDYNKTLAKHSQRLNIDSKQLERLKTDFLELKDDSSYYDVTDGRRFPWKEDFRNKVYNAILQKRNITDVNVDKENNEYSKLINHTNSEIEKNVNLEPINDEETNRRITINYNIDIQNNDEESVRNSQSKMTKVKKFTTENKIRFDDDQQIDISHQDDYYTDFRKNGKIVGMSMTINNNTEEIKDQNNKDNKYWIKNFNKETSNDSLLEKPSNMPAFVKKHRSYESMTRELDDLSQMVDLDELENKNFLKKQIVDRLNFAKEEKLSFINKKINDKLNKISTEKYKLQQKKINFERQLYRIMNDPECDSSNLNTEESDEEMINSIPAIPEYRKRKIRPINPNFTPYTDIIQTNVNKFSKTRSQRQLINKYNDEYKCYEPMTRSLYNFYLDKKDFYNLNYHDTMTIQKGINKYQYYFDTEQLKSKLYLINSRNIWDNAIKYSLQSYIRCTNQVKQRFSRKSSSPKKKLDKTSTKSTSALNRNSQYNKSNTKKQNIIEEDINSIMYSEVSDKKAIEFNIMVDDTTKEKYYNVKNYIKDQIQEQVLEEDSYQHNNINPNELNDIEQISKMYEEKYQVKQNKQVEDKNENENDIKNSLILNAVKSNINDATEQMNRNDQIMSEMDDTNYKASRRYIRSNRNTVTSVHKDSELNSNSELNNTPVVPSRKTEFHWGTNENDQNKVHKDYDPVFNKLLYNEVTDSQTFQQKFFKKVKEDKSNSNQENELSEDEEESVHQSQEFISPETNDPDIVREVKELISFFNMDELSLSKSQSLRYQYLQSKYNSQFVIDHIKYQEQKFNKDLQELEDQDEMLEIYKPKIRKNVRMIEKINTNSESVESEECSTAEKGVDLAKMIQYNENIEVKSRMIKNIYEEKIDTDLNDYFNEDVNPKQEFTNMFSNNTKDEDSRLSTDFYKLTNDMHQQPFSFIKTSTDDLLQQMEAEMDERDRDTKVQKIRESVEFHQYVGDTDYDIKDKKMNLWKK